MRATKFIAILMMLVALGVSAAPFGGDAQESGKVPRVGFLGPRSRSDGPFVGAFLQGLRELGWVEGQNIAIEYRFAEGRLDRLPDLAAELVRLKVDVILCNVYATSFGGQGCDENYSHRHGNKR
jgi:putative tryptophan/tyrosine transport system substrate-binding protein